MIALKEKKGWSQITFPPTEAGVVQAKKALDTGKYEVYTDKTGLLKNYTPEKASKKKSTKKKK